MKMTDAQLAALGRITVVFSEMELITAGVVAGLIGGDQEVGLTVGALLPISKMLDLVAALVHLKFEDPRVRAEADDIIKSARQAEQSRNRIVHSLWMHETGTKTDGVVTRVKASAKGRLDYRIEPMSAADILKVVEDIADATGRLLSFAIGHRLIPVDATGGTPAIPET